MLGSTITIQTSAEVAAAIAKLAESMNQSTNWIIEAALKNYIDLQAWQIEGIRKGLAQADARELEPHDKVFSKLRAQIDEHDKPS